jgi:hypothetical protein
MMSSDRIGTPLSVVCPKRHGGEYWGSMIRTAHTAHLSSDAMTMAPNDLLGVRSMLCRRSSVSHRKTEKNTSLNA